MISTPLKNISQLGWLFPIYENIKKNPNHQPESLKYINHSYIVISTINHRIQRCLNAAPAILEVKAGPVEGAAWPPLDRPQRYSRRFNAGNFKIGFGTLPGGVERSPSFQCWGHLYSGISCFFYPSKPVEHHQVYSLWIWHKIQLDPLETLQKSLVKGHSPGFKLSHVTPLNEEIRNESWPILDKLQETPIPNGKQW